MGTTSSKPIESISERSSDQLSFEHAEVITRQACNESVYIMRGKDEDRPAWHIILISYEKRAALDHRERGSLVNVDDFGRNIEYRTQANVICQASGYGTDPPESMLQWINEQYDPCATDESTSLIYTADDIRLCTIRRVTFEQPLGIFLRYHRHECFHYAKLNDDYQSTLAFHAGIKQFDRIIECNGINIEEQTSENLNTRMNDNTDELLQLLVCSPATYTYYKKNNKPLHSNIETVAYLRPVRDTTGIIIPPGRSTSNGFCAVQWTDNRSIDTVSVSAVHTSSQSVQWFETYAIEDNGRKRKGQIMFIGSQNTCDLLKQSNSTCLITLQNSKYIVAENRYDTPQAMDDALYFTAHQQPMEDTTKSYVPPSDETSNQSQVTVTQTAAVCEKKIDEEKGRELERQSAIRHRESLIADDQHNAPNGVEIHYVPCLGCKVPRIYSDRYKCLECDDFNLCGRCFDRRYETLTHVNGHVMIHFSNPDEIFGESVINVNTNVTLSKFQEKYASEEHPNVECNSCKTMPLKGLRFKCDVCHNYDLCIVCMQRRIHDKSHPLIAIGKTHFLEIPVDDLQLNDELGRGGFGTVYKAQWLSKNRQVACKVISVSPDHDHLEKSFRKELAAYAELSGPYILKTYGYNIQYLSTGIQKLMLVMEYMPRGSLSRVLKQKEKISLRRKLEMACQIASAIRKLHAHRMIHRDIRPDNILVTQDYTAKLGDMGLARVWSPDENLTLVGCTAYMPLDFYSGRYNQSLDIYTFGLTINELFTERRHHFDLLTRRATLVTPSPVFTDLITRCINTKPNQRPTALDIETTLQMYKQSFEKYVDEENIKYADMSTDDKNLIFLEAYEAFRIVDETLKLTTLPSSSHSALASTTSANQNVI